ncbi:MAG: diguanylate cyclase [Symbiobacterium sp.]|uniref:diguanylate cyclase n=1 Tax=Symbiobacterium sp. TaxID=1971213 RepID=UPI003463A719
MSEGVADLDRAVAALQRLLTDPHAPEQPPAELRTHKGFAELYQELAAVRSHLQRISHGNLSQPIRQRGLLSGYLKSLQAELRHLTWQTQRIAAGDFSQRVEFLGEFSAAFNTMTEALARTTAELSQSVAHYRLLAENVADVILTLDRTGRLTYVSPSVFRLAGYQPDELVGRSLTEVTSLKGPPRPDTVVELQVRCKDGTERWAEMTTAALPAETGAEAVLVCVLRDTTDRKRLELNLEQLATVDGLTGAFNRRFFVQLCEREIAEAPRRCRPVALVMLDVDHFKRINDQYGHSAGDEVLRQVVRTGRQVLRAEDAFGRVGGDEFAVLLPGTTAEQAVRVAERLRAAYAETEVTPDAGVRIRFTASFGVAQWRPEWRTADDLLLRADRALYAAKRAGRNCVCTDTEGDQGA